MHRVFKRSIYFSLFSLFLFFLNICNYISIKIDTFKCSNCNYMDYKKTKTIAAAVQRIEMMIIYDLKIKGRIQQNSYAGTHKKKVN